MGLVVGSVGSYVWLVGHRGQLVLSTAILVPDLFLGSIGRHQDLEAVLSIPDVYAYFLNASYGGW